jgi:hypothetical protein
MGFAARGSKVLINPGTGAYEGYLVQPPESLLSANSDPSFSKRRFRELRDATRPRSQLYSYVARSVVGGALAISLLIDTTTK